MAFVMPAQALAHENNPRSPSCPSRCTVDLAQDAASAVLLRELEPRNGLSVHRIDYLCVYQLGTRSHVPSPGTDTRWSLLMPYRPTGVGAFGFSVNWEKVPGDEDVARRVITFLEDRRLLFGERHFEDELHCVRSAIEIRQFLTHELTQAKPGRSLADSIRAVRAAMRAFVEAAGPDACNFRYRHGPAMTDHFSLALGELRGLVGLHLAMIAGQYGIEVEADLAQILPPDVLADDDPSFVPGFGDPA